MADSTISFIEHYAPALTTGTYEVNVRTTFGESGGLLPAQIGEISEWVYVSGERFFINPADVDSVYPPMNGNDFYEETLPHIVFRRGGFPWEREIMPPDDQAGPRTPPARDESGRVVRQARSSWLALLLFNEDDPAPTPKRVPIGRLTREHIPQGTWFPPAFRVAPDEDAAAQATVIDLPAVLFDAIKPRPADLQYLAHARKVGVTHKAGYDKSRDPAEHEYSVVMANRIPRPGKETVVHLVSLEQYLPILEADVPATHPTVRLVSLKNWRFSCADSGGGFADYLKGLNGGTLATGSKAGGITTGAATTEQPLYLHLPFQRTSGPLKKALSHLQQGYLPMEHKFRQGLRSISWYRGPLCPGPIAPTLAPPFLSADALLIYDPEAGYYDVSYAAAWQLGQLLALRNKAFARAQYFWKQQTDIDARKRAERKLLSDKLPLLKAGKDGELPLPSFEILAQSVTQLDAATNLPDRTPGGLSDQLDPTVAATAAAVQPDWFQTIQTYLTALRGLRDVPYNYLVADPKLLPVESLRFFHVDPDWVSALVDGAFSLGDLIDRDAVRKRVLLAETDAETATNFSGFLLRSSIMRVWPGMEVRAFDAAGKLLGFVRHERLAGEVLLCIVEGRLSRIELREPPEALHFGVNGPGWNEEGPTKFTKKIRGIDGNYIFTDFAGEATNRGVIKMATFADRLVADLPTAAHAAFGSKFTTADFGYAMIEPVTSVSIMVEGPPQSA